MKKGLFIAVALCMCCHVVFSQETEKVKTEPVNEIKFNLLTCLALYPEISYERSLTEDFGLGLAIAVSLYDDIIPYSFQMTPYFRFYFVNNPVKAFFIEMNAALVSSKDYYYDGANQNVADFGLGLALGYKVFNRKGLIGEFYLGLGRTFGDRAYPRLGVSIGKQF